MKPFILIISILIFSFTILFADEIYLKNSKIIKGKVIQIKDDNLEYSEYNGKPFLIIPMNQVEKILYSLDNDDVDIIETKVQQPSIEKNETNIETRYLDSYLKLFLIAGMSFVDGNITNKEKKVFNENKSALQSDDGSYSMDYYSFPRGFELTGLLPALIQKDSISSYNLGLKTRYTFTTLDQVAESSDSPNDKYYTGVLLKYYTISAGPEFNMVLSRKSSYIDFIWQIYLLYGYIPYGRLYAATCVREGYADQGEAGIDSSQTKSNFTGYSLTGGMGFYLSFNRKFPLIIGLNIFFTSTEINFKKAVPVYGGAKSSSFDEKGFLITLGTHFWTIK